MTDDIEMLHGGVANAGAVMRVGSLVERPANPYSGTIHELLRHVRGCGFTGASEPVDIIEGRERMVFSRGEVPIPPYPAWAQRDEALVSIARLIRGLHDASAGFDSAVAWSDEMRDPSPGTDTVVCHNDVCLENVVFRDGEAVTLLDFDFAAPGRREFDLAAFARMCVPVDADDATPTMGWRSSDRPRRVRLIADAYGLGAAGRAEMLSCLDDAIARGGAFVLRRVEAGEPAFIEMWESMGGMARFDRRRAWWATDRPAFAVALA